MYLSSASPPHKHELPLVSLTALKCALCQMWNMPSARDVINQTNQRTYAAASLNVSADKLGHANKGFSAAVKTSGTAIREAVTHSRRTGRRVEVWPRCAVGRD